jgi:glucoamylase
MICAAEFARCDGDEEIAALLESYADFLRSHLEDWTVTTKGSLLAGSPRHFVRLNPMQPGEAVESGAVDRAELFLTSQPPDQRRSYPARDVVDAGFLQLVRYGILPAGDPLVVESLRVVDSVLKTEMPSGPCWRRYNHDGYGQKLDGGPYTEWGQGRPWPLLTGERGHYEQAAGRDCRQFLKAMEGFASATGLLPEQIWDAADIPDARLRRGGPTGSANPLLWAHSEYVRLLRSHQDGRVFDCIPEVLNRYRNDLPSTRIEYWLAKHPIRQTRKNHTIRILVAETFRLRWSADGWKTWKDSDSRPTGLGAAYFDISAEDAKSKIDFTFFWPDRNQWEGRNYDIEVIATFQETAV